MSIDKHSRSLVMLHSSQIFLYKTFKFNTTYYLEQINLCTKSPFLTEKKIVLCQQESHLTLCFSLRARSDSGVSVQPGATTFTLPRGVTRQISFFSDFASPYSRPALAAA